MYQKNKTEKTLAIGIVFVVMGIFLLAGCEDNVKNKAEVEKNPAPAENKDDGLPPDPGEAGKATIGGIDSDNDGLRDDIQRHIAITYPNSEKTRAALTQYAKSVQGAVLDANDKELSMKHAEESSKASDCGIYLLGFKEYYAAEDNLTPLLLNTDARTKAYLDYDSQLGGEVFSDIPDDELATACNFVSTD